MPNDIKTQNSAKSENSEAKVITFKTLFDALVQKIIVIDKLPEVVADQDGEVMPKLVHTAIERFFDSLSLSQQQSISARAGQLLCEDGSVCLGGEDVAVEDAIIAIYIMTHEDEKLKYHDVENSPCVLDNPLDLSVHCIGKEQHVEDNSWSWFSDELWDYGVISEVEHLYLLKINYEDVTDIDTFSLYKTNDKATSKEALYRFAQFFLSGNADTEQGCFVLGESKQYPLEAILIGQADFKSYQKLGFRVYSALTDIPADMDEVNAFLDDEY